MLCPVVLAKIQEGFDFLTEGAVQHRCSNEIKRMLLHACLMNRIVSFRMFTYSLNL